MNVNSIVNEIIIFKIVVKEEIIKMNELREKLDIYSLSGVISLIRKYGGKEKKSKSEI